MSGNSEDAATVLLQNYVIKDCERGGERHVKYAASGRLITTAYILTSDYKKLRTG